jgi:hypothetical protein
MANRRQVKQNINHLIGDVIEEYYNALLDGDGKNEEKIEKLVDECVELADELIARVNATRKLKTRGEIKKHYSEIKEKLGDSVLASLDTINEL